MQQLKRLIQFASVVIFPTLFITIPKLPAYADGCSPQASFYRTCTTVEHVNGDGLKITKATGDFKYLSAICFWHYKFAFYNESDIQLTSATTPISKTCDNSGNKVKTWSPPFKASKGRVCGQLYRRDTLNGKDLMVDASCVGLPL